MENEMETGIMQGYIGATCQSRKQSSLRLEQQLLEFTLLASTALFGCELCSAWF